MKPWQEMYNEWKYWNPEKTTEERTKLVRGCVGKMAYPDFLLAMQGALQINRREPEAKINIYLCPICHRMHIGNTKWKLKL